MTESLQITNLVINGLTMLGFIGGFAAVFIRVGKREEQIDHLAISISRQSESTDRLDRTLRALEIALTALTQTQREHERRLSRIENGG